MYIYLSKINTTIFEKYTNKFPVNVSGLAEELGIEIIKYIKFQDSPYGDKHCFTNDYGKYTIFISKEIDNPDLQRFCIAYELAKFIFDKDDPRFSLEHINSLEEMLNNNPVQTLPESKLKYNPIEKIYQFYVDARIDKEWMCEEFAFQLLMPDKILIEKSNEFKENMELLSEYFGVHKEYIKGRLEQLSGRYFPNRL